MILFLTFYFCLVNLLPHDGQSAARKLIERVRDHRLPSDELTMARIAALTDQQNLCALPGSAIQRVKSGNWSSWTLPKPGQASDRSVRPPSIAGAPQRGRAREDRNYFAAANFELRFRRRDFLVLAVYQSPGFSAAHAPVAVISGIRFFRSKGARRSEAIAHSLGFN
jgi:hypothetical protein